MIEIQGTTIDFGRVLSYRIPSNARPLIKYSMNSFNRILLEHVAFSDGGRCALQSDTPHKVQIQERRLSAPVVVMRFCLSLPTVCPTHPAALVALAALSPGAVHFAPTGEATAQLQLRTSLDLKGVTRLASLARTGLVGGQQPTIRDCQSLRIPHSDSIYLKCKFHS
ncbi:hypothetical protein ICJ04_00820 [Stenotrophomonas sp. 169]|uniref:hypothetical protein n=1 Tax=Stenotrophomonas sp. 169 TaxID=2770322 RepID=UPI0016626F5D|nr:hypothetical protein [Stenotrophomonas sp. 169]QNR99231.1 hypothetical protein ICJ04_00820 [Stenotrophomonas sp. 169]